MIKRLAFRVQPIKHILSREQRHKEMQEREKPFGKFVEAELKKTRRRK